MQRNIILFSTVIFTVLTLWISETIFYRNKLDTISDLEVEQKKVNEKFITAQILSQSMDRVYKIFKNNLKSKKNKEILNKTMPFLDNLTDILSALEIKTLYIRPLQVNKQKNYVLSPYQIEIECPYEKFGKLLSKLEKNDRLIIINQFHINNGYERVTNISKSQKLPDPLITIELSTISLNKIKS